MSERVDVAELRRQFIETKHVDTSKINWPLTVGMWIDALEAAYKELDTLTRDRDAARREAGHWSEQCNKAEIECDEARAECERLRTENQELWNQNEKVWNAYNQIADRYGFAKATYPNPRRG